METGATDIVRYVQLSDFGTVINPMLLEGQIHGGVAQGIGQVMFEEIRYDDDGQLLTGSFLDYNVPKADQLPHLVLGAQETPSPTNALGAKGVGECGVWRQRETPYLRLWAWPTTGQIQVFDNLAMDRTYKIREGDPSPLPVELRRFGLAPAGAGVAKSRSTHPH